MTPLRLLCFWGVLTVGNYARADGAFPDELAAFLPPDSNTIVVATNFGLLQSLDGGPFLFVCEAATGATRNVGPYQADLGGTILAEAGQGLLRSADWGCGWQPASGTVSGLYVYDAAFDPSSPRVLAIAPTLDAGIGALYPSDDRGASFGLPVSTVVGFFNGVEFSVVSPGTVFAVGNETAADGGIGVPFIASSVDRGQTWTSLYQHPELSGLIVRLAQVDPTVPDTLYLRVNAAFDELWVSRDGGKTLQKLFTAPQPLSAFLAAADGTLFAGTRVNGLYRAPASDAGAFALVNSSVRPRCLAERGGLLYACGDDFADGGFALGTRADQGATFSSVVRFDQIAGLAPCSEPSFAQTCAFAWQTIAELFGIGDAGTGTDGGMPASSGSCGGCTSSEGVAGLLALAVILASRSRRRRR
jgi:uncharacterized protein (TIGR03382 family)